MKTGIRTVLAAWTFQSRSILGQVVRDIIPDRLPESESKNLFWNNMRMQESPSLNDRRRFQYELEMTGKNLRHIECEL